MFSASMILGSFTTAMVPRRRTQGGVVLAMILSASASAASESQPLSTLHLKNGSVLVGEVVSESGDVIVFHADGIGEIRISRALVSTRLAGGAGAVDVPALGVTPSVSRSSDAISSGRWSSTFTLGGNYISSRNEQGRLEGTLAGVSGEQLRLPGTHVSAQGKLSLSRKSVRQETSIVGSVTYADVKPAGRVTESYELEADHRINLAHRWYAVSVTSVKRDELRGLGDATSQLLGIGRKIVDSPRLKVDVNPGVGLQRFNKGTRHDGNLQLGLGFLLNIGATTSRGVGLEHRLLFHTIFEDLSLVTIDTYFGVKAPVTKRIALTIGLESDYDRVLALRTLNVAPNAIYPGSPAATFFPNPSWINQLTTGIQFHY